MKNTQPMRLLPLYSYIYTWFARAFIGIFKRCVNISPLPSHFPVYHNFFRHYSYPAHSPRLKENATSQTLNKQRA